MIKIATVALLCLRIFRSNRRASALVLLSQAAVRARLLARRICNEWLRWRMLIPCLLVCFRSALGPVMILLCLVCERGAVAVTCIGLALLSDVFDGVLARRWHLDTETLRRWDTRADTFFYACVLGMIWLRHPDTIERRSLLIAGLVTAEVIQHVFAAAKYGRHARLSFLALEDLGTPDGICHDRTTGLEHR